MYFATVVCPTSIPSESFYTWREAQIVIESWRRHYNTIRPHASLGFKSPAKSAFAGHAGETAYLKLTFHLDPLSGG